MTKCHILSLDGGGIRGLVTTVMLERLEHKLKEHDPNKLLRDYFDIIAGTSTGSIIACGVAKGIAASKIKDFYIQEGIKIFPPFRDVFGSLLSRVSPGFSQPIYDGEGLDSVLQTNGVFGQMLFEDLEKPTLVTSYDTYNRQAVVLKNTQQECEKIPVWEVCRASSAVPAAFPAHLLKHEPFLNYWENEKKKEIAKDGQGERCLPLVDGGMVANNPALCAIAERIRWNDSTERLPAPKWNIPQMVELKDILVASFGTGQNVDQIDVVEASNWGVLEWASPRKGIPLLDVVFDGSSDAVDYITSQILKEKNYFRFQPNLVQDFPGFNANPGKLRAMQIFSRNFLDTPEVDGKLQQLVDALTETPVFNPV